jgi:hypothetical protein
MSEAIGEEKNTRMLIVLAVGAAATLMIIAAFYFINRAIPAPVAPVVAPLPMGPAEQAYASQIQFTETTVGRAANFLNQEVTFVFGTVNNHGSRAIKQIEITLEFHDIFNQVVLRDKQRLFGENAVPLPPNGTRDFQIGYETMPAQWNQAYPTARITGLALQ